MSHLCASLSLCQKTSAKLFFNDKFIAYFLSAHDCVILHKAKQMYITILSINNHKLKLSPPSTGESNSLFDDTNWSDGLPHKFSIVVLVIPYYQ